MKLLPSPLVCREAVELVADYVEGALSPRATRRLEKHLAKCPHCSAYLSQISSTIAASGTVGPEDLEPEVLSGLVDLFRSYQADTGDSVRDPLDGGSASPS